MVVRMKTPTKKAQSESTADPLRGVQAGSGIEKESSSSAEIEFARLKSLVPSISQKTTVTRLDVVLEAIRYIDQLQDQLLEQIAEKRINPQHAAEFLVGKENSQSDFVQHLLEGRKSSKNQ